MNKKSYSKLSDSDRKHLAAIEENYRQSETIFGPEPLIIYKFNLSAPGNDERNADLELRRKEVFAKESFILNKANN